MLKVLSFVSLSLLALACKPRVYNGSVQSDTGNAAQVSPRDCVFLGDKFEPRAKFPPQTTKGKAGLCIDTRTARPVKRLTAEEASEYGFTPSPNTMILANITHRDNFYVGAIPVGVKDVARVVFQEEGFPAVVPAAHGQIRVDFNRAVVLQPQIPGKGETFSTMHMLLSMEALGEPDWSYDLMKGLKDSFVGVWRVKTLNDFATRMSKQDPKHVVKQYWLSFDSYPEQRLAILMEWIKRSEENQLTRMYNTITSSCAMEALNVVESVRNSAAACEREDPKQMQFLQQISAQVNSMGQKALLWADRRVATPFEVYPTFAATALKARALWKADLPLFDQDPVFPQLLQ